MLIQRVIESLFIEVVSLSSVDLDDVMGTDGTHHGRPLYRLALNQAFDQTPPEGITGLPGGMVKVAIIAILIFSIRHSEILATGNI